MIDKYNKQSRIRCKSKFQKFKRNKVSFHKTNFAIWAKFFGRHHLNFIFSNETSLAREIYRNLMVFDRLSYATILLTEHNRLLFISLYKYLQTRFYIKPYATQCFFMPKHTFLLTHIKNTHTHIKTFFGRTSRYRQRDV